MVGFSIGFSVTVACIKTLYSATSYIVYVAGTVYISESDTFTKYIWATVLGTKIRDYKINTANHHFQSPGPDPESEAISPNPHVG